MSQLEAIKYQFHHIIDQVDNETVLTRYLGAIYSEVKGTTDFWSGVAPEEKTQILEAYEESKNSANWISHEEVKRKYNKWLTK